MPLRSPARYLALAVVLLGLLLVGRALWPSGDQGNEPARAAASGPPTSPPGDAPPAGVPVAPEVPAAVDEVALTIHVGGARERMRRTLRASYGFFARDVLPDEVEHVAPETTALILAHADHAEILEVAHREGLTLEALVEDGVTLQTLPVHDPWRLVLAAEVARIQRNADWSAALETIYAVQRERLGLPDDAEPARILEALEADPEQRRAFFQAAREAGRSTAEVNPVARLLTRHPDAPPLAADLARLYVLESRVDGAQSGGPSQVDDAVEAGLDLLAQTPDRPVARQALMLLQNLGSPVDPSGRALLEEYAAEEPDLFPITAQLALRSAWEVRAYDEVADWLIRTDAWAAERCPCATPDPTKPVQFEAQCDALCEIDAALRTFLLREGHLEPQAWTDGLRLAAATCHARAPLDAAVDGRGRWTDAWQWAWPTDSWAACFEAEAAHGPGPEGPVDVRVEVVPHRAGR